MLLRALSLVLVISLSTALQISAQSKLGTYSPSVGDWFLDANGNFAYDGADKHSTGNSFSGGIPVVGDWTGDGVAKIGVYIDGFWLLDMNNNGVWDGPNVDRFVALGGPGQTPVVGDWNGDGRSKVGVYNGGFWALDYNGDGQWDTSAGDRFIALGGNGNGEQPVVGDWNGDGRTKVGYFYVGTGVWALDYNGNGTWDSGDAFYYLSQGAGSVGVVGRWAGVSDRRTKVGVFNAGFWLIDLNGNGQFDGTTIDRFAGIGGNAGEVPVVGDWNGDTFDKIGVFRNGGTWNLDLNGNYVWDSADVIATFSDQVDSAGKPLVGNWSSSGSFALPIKGQVLTGDGTAVPGVTVSLQGPMPAGYTSDSAGYFYLAGFPGGNYTVTASLSSFEFSPSYSVANNLASPQQITFTLRPPDYNTGLPTVPNSFTAPNPVLTCDDISGSWDDYLVGTNAGIRWNLTQSGSNVLGTMAFDAIVNNTYCDTYFYDVNGSSSNASFSLTANLTGSRNGASCGPISSVFPESGSLSGRACGTGSFQQSDSRRRNWTTKSPRMSIQYSSFIPVDHLSGPTSCHIPNTFSYGGTLIYKGDAYRGTYRTTESVLVVAGSPSYSNLFARAGPTRNYQYPSSPRFGGNLSSNPTGDLWNDPYSGADEDQTALDCYLWNNKGEYTQDTMRGINVSVTGTNTNVRFTGFGRDPLEPQVGGINWDLTVTIDTSDAANPKAYVSGGSQSCYPEHIIKVNGVTIYDARPLFNNVAYLTVCLLGPAVSATPSSPVSIPLY